MSGQTYQHSASMHSSSPLPLPWMWIFSSMGNSKAGLEGQNFDVVEQRNLRVCKAGKAGKMYVVDELVSMPNSSRLDPLLALRS